MIDFDRVLHQVGGFGRYQVGIGLFLEIGTVLLVSLANLLFSW